MGDQERPCVESGRQEGGEGPRPERGGRHSREARGHAPQEGLEFGWRRPLRSEVPTDTPEEGWAMQSVGPWAGASFAAEGAPCIQHADRGGGGRGHRLLPARGLVVEPHCGLGMGGTSCAPGLAASGRTAKRKGPELSPGAGADVAGEGICELPGGGHTASSSLRSAAPPDWTAVLGICRMLSDTASVVTRTTGGVGRPQAPLAQPAGGRGPRPRDRLRLWADAGPPHHGPQPCPAATPALSPRLSWASPQALCHRRAQAVCRAVSTRLSNLL